MEKLISALKSMGDAFTVMSQFSWGYQLFFVLSAVYFVVAIGLFIHQYTAASLQTRTSVATMELEKKAIAGTAEAMTQLSISDSPRAFSILASLAENSPEEKTRIAAILAIANLNDKRKIPLLGAILVKEKWEVAAASAKALARSKENLAVPYLIRALDINVDWLVAQKSAEALGFFEPSEATSRALVVALNRGSFQGEAAKQSLINQGAAVVPVLVANLREADSYESILLTVETLRVLGDKQALPIIREVKDRVEQLNIDAQLKARLSKEIRGAISALEHAPSRISDQK